MSECEWPNCETEGKEQAYWGVWEEEWADHTFCEQHHMKFIG